jgi:hypothetical protein
MPATSSHVDRWTTTSSSCAAIRLYDLYRLLVQEGDPTLTNDGELLAFGAVQISSGVWAITPSLNVPGQLHAFVVIRDVPSPAPWERQLVVLAAT